MMRVEAPDLMRYDPQRTRPLFERLRESNMLLNRTTYLIKERVAMMKLTDRYDIFDPEVSPPPTIT